MSDYNNNVFRVRRKRHVILAMVQNDRRSLIHALGYQCARVSTVN